MNDNQHSFKIKTLTKIIFCFAGDLGVETDGDASGDNLISGAKTLLFLFPRNKPAVLLQITLSDFDSGDLILLQFNNDQSADEDDVATTRKRDAGGSTTLFAEISSTGEGIVLFVLFFWFHRRLNLHCSNEKWLYNV
jgi:hypothetical protein